MYKQLYGTSSILRLSDGAIISPSESQDWIDFQNWLDLGNTPEPYISLVQAKQDKISELDTVCQTNIVGGFVSSALGSDHVYDSQIEDQINLIGVMLAAQATGTSIEYKCMEVISSNKQWVSHTPQQIGKVYMDGLLFKSEQMHKLSTLKETINNLTTIEEVNGVTW